MSDAPDRGSRVPPAERLAEVMEARATPRRSVAAKALHELAQVDLAVYRAIAGTPTPTLDEPLRRLSGLANHSKLWVGAAAALFALGPTGRRAAATGLIAVGINSAVVNLPMKLASRRDRPDREAAGVPEERHVPMPTSTSFPSGHSASAFAFAGAVAGSMPVFGAPFAAWPQRSPTHACTRACTTRATSSSGRSSGGRSARRPRSLRVPCADVTTGPSARRTRPTRPDRGR